MKIAIGCDHAGFELKESVKVYLNKQGLSFQDFGCYNEESIDYPDYAHPVADFVEANEDAIGILICGSGNGISMTANKHQGIRCALCWTEEIASLARQHNNANVISLPARFIEQDLALKMIQVFLDTEFEGGRHANRVAKITCS